MGSGSVAPAGVVFTSVDAAELTYYGLLHVLESFDLSASQLAAALAAMAQAKLVCKRARRILYPLPEDIQRELRMID